MTSFCGFCGSKATDDRASFCSDCGGKLEQSVEDTSSEKTTVPLPAMEPKNQPGVLLSKSFVDLIKKEASGSTEASPAALVELSKSFLSSISDSGTEDPLLSRDTLREVSPLHAAHIPTREPVVTLPDFLAPIQSLSNLEPMTLPLETNPRAPALKIPKIATPAAPAAALELARDTLPEALRAAPQAPDEEQPSVLLSNSMEGIILQEKLKVEPRPEEPPEKRPAPELPPTAAPRSAFPKPGAPPKSVLLASPASILSEGFAERLAQASPRSLFSLAELPRAAKSRWVQAILLVSCGPLLVRILQEVVWSGFVLLQPLLLGLLACLLFFRLLAEERQPFWRSLAPLLVSYLLGLGALKSFAGALHTKDLLHLGLFSLLVVCLLGGSLAVSWLLGPRLKIFTQPMDGLLLGTFSGAGVAAGIFASPAEPLVFLSILFTEMLCGGLAGYFWGLAAYKSSEQKSFGAAATVGVFVVHSGLFLLVSMAFKEEGAGLGLLLFGAGLALGYLALFGYAIKLKLLERN